MSNFKLETGGNAENNVITVGSDNNVRAQITVRKLNEPLPPAEAVDIAGELASLRKLLSELATANAQKIARALEDADEEARKAKPDPDQVGSAVERALKYAQQADAFASSVGSLVPHVTNLVAWLGTNWHRLLQYVGVSL